MAERYIPEHRRTQFKAKNTFKPEELRRRREEQQVEIRKAKREENLAKRRGIGTGSDRPGASLGAAPDSDDDTAPTESQVCVGVFFYPTMLLLLSYLVPLATMDLKFPFRSSPSPLLPLSFSVLLLCPACFVLLWWAFFFFIFHRVLPHSLDRETKRDDPPPLMTLSWSLEYGILSFRDPVEVMSISPDIAVQLC